MNMTKYRWSLSRIPCMIINYSVYLFLHVCGRNSAYSGDRTSCTICQKISWYLISGLVWRPCISFYIPVVSARTSRRGKKRPNHIPKKKKNQETYIHKEIWFAQCGISNVNTSKSSAANYEQIYIPSARYSSSFFLFLFFALLCAHRIVDAWLPGLAIGLIHRSMGIAQSAHMRHEENNDEMNSPRTLKISALALHNLSIHSIKRIVAHQFAHHLNFNWMIR